MCEHLPLTLKVEREREYRTKSKSHGGQDVCRQSYLQGVIVSAPTKTAISCSEIILQRPSYTLLNCLEMLFILSYLRTALPYFDSSVAVPDTLKKAGF